VSQNRVSSSIESGTESFWSSSLAHLLALAGFFLAKKLRELSHFVDFVDPTSHFWEGERSGSSLAPPGNAYKWIRASNRSRSSTAVSIFFLGYRRGSHRFL